MERRLQRFLANARLSWQQSAQALARWVLTRLVTKGLVVLLVDETSLKDRLKVMAVSLALCPWPGGVTTPHSGP